MALKINPENALKQINNYLNRIDGLLKINYKEGGKLKSELDSEIRGFLTSAFENGDKKGYSSSPVIFMASGLVRSESEKQESLYFRS